MLQTIGGSVGGDCSSDLDHDLACIILALSIVGNIWVALISHQTELLDVSIAICVEATIASVISVIPGAVNKLLLSKNYTAIVFKGIVLLDRASCGERPAATALSLILNRPDDPEITPVNRLRLALLKWANNFTFLRINLRLA